MDLGFWQALSLWWSGVQLTDHLLYGMSILWLGRIGKLVSFLAGTTIILDFIGPERLRELGDRIKGNKESVKSSYSCLGVAIDVFAWFLLALVIIPIPFAALYGFRIFGSPEVFVGVLFLTGVFITGASAINFIIYTLGPMSFIAWIFSFPRLERLLRASAICLFFLGFALDYLAS